MIQYAEISGHCMVCHRQGAGLDGIALSDKSLHIYSAIKEQAAYPNVLMHQTALQLV